MNKGKLKKKVAIITGASRGIGKAIALALAGEGVNLFLSARSGEKLKELEEDVKVLGVKGKSYVGDLSSPKICCQIIDSCISHYGSIDYLINNAGIALCSPLSKTTTEQWNDIMAVNATAPFILSRQAIPYLRKSRDGVIVNISSVVGEKAYELQGAYTASKHALMGMSKVLALELQEYGVRVHTVSPGGVDTSMIKCVRPDLKSSHLISCDEVAEAVVLLLKQRGNAVIDNIKLRRRAGTPWF